MRPLTAAAAAALGLVLVLASCATSSGGTYSRAASSESGAAREGRRDGPATPPPRPPSGGAPPVIRIEQAKRVDEGRLALAGLPSDAVVYVDGIARWGSRISLPIGRHEVRIGRFGSEDMEATVYILLDEETRLAVDLPPAMFSIAGMEAVPPSFDPRDPGHLGTCQARIEATARGSGSVYVLDASGTRVRSLGRADFNRRRTALSWDGRDDSGRVLGPGTYEIVAEGRGESGEGRASARVEIARGRFERSAVLHGGVSGSLFSPDARCLDPFRIETSAGAVFHVDPNGSSMSGMGTIETGIRVGIASLPAGGAKRPAALELDASVMGVIWPSDPLADSASFSAALKGALASADGRRAAGLYVRATWVGFTSAGSGDARPSWDGAARYPGLAIGAPLELAFERSRIFVSPELEVSDYYPYWYGSPLPWSPPGLFAWGYLRAGIEASVGRSLTLGFSGALRTEPFGAGLGIRWPLPLGFEARWHAPGVPLTLSFAATGEIDSLDAYYFGAGVFAAFRF